MIGANYLTLSACPRPISCKGMHCIVSNMDIHDIYSDKDMLYCWSLQRNNEKQQFLRILREPQA